jgi:hypothetical protein
VAKNSKTAVSRRREVRSQTALYEQFIGPLAQQPALLLIFGICVIFGGSLGGAGLIRGSEVAIYGAVGALALALLAAIAVVWITQGANSRSIETEVGHGRSVMVPTEIVVPQQSVLSPSPNIFKDDLHQFAFNRPQTGAWSEPELLTGFDNFLAAHAQVDAETIAAANRFLRINPYGRAIQELEQLRLTSGKGLDIQFSPESTWDWFEAISPGLLQELRIQNPVSPDQEIQKSLIALRQSIVSGAIQSATHFNEFSITWFDKSKIVGITPRLASLAIFFLRENWPNLHTFKTFGNNITAVWRMSYRKLKINGVLSDFSVEYMDLYTEGTKYFYQAEIKYSPQTQDSIEIWGDLRNMVESFRVLE